MAQTKKQSRKFIAGSAAVYIGERFDKLVNIGACRSINVEETKTTAEIESDNAGVIASVVTEHSMTVSLESLEIDWKKYALIRGNTDNYEFFDGKTKVEKEYPVSAGTWKAGEKIKVPFKNGDKTDVKVLEIFAESEDERTKLVLDEDYILDGTNGVEILKDDFNPETHSLHISYEWTPPLMSRFGTGGGETFVKPVVMKIVNTNSDGKEFRIYIPEASVEGGLKRPFNSDKANDVMKVAFSFKARLATDYTKGEQLAVIENEQNEVTSPAKPLPVPPPTPEPDEEDIDEEDMP